MKKWVVLLILLVVIAIAAFYFFIPARTRIHEEIRMAVNAKGFSRNISDDKKWSLWWPEKNAAAPSPGRFPGFRFHGNTYTILEKKLTSIILSIKTENDSLLTELVFIPLNNDSVMLNWEARGGATVNPARRLQMSSEIKKIRTDLQTILQSIQQFYSVEANLYGIPIKKETVLDSTLISTSAVSNGYPSIESIYTLIDKLKTFAAKHGAKQTGLPMLNVNTSDSISYLTKVALPVDKKLKDEGDVAYRWMLGGGNILVADVKGGPAAINQVFTEMENYIHDFQRIAPAIPFQSLVTDRSKEGDTGKWVTKLYWPVM